MQVSRVIKPHFMIIGAQKCGTTWLWEMLKQHPGTDLNMTKELFFFSSSELYNKGIQWYYNNFNELNPEKIVGEATTQYFYDYVLRNDLLPDKLLPKIPELIVKYIPDIKIFIILRDPVKRAISAYYHHMQRRKYSPYLPISKVLKQHPELRIVELGHYARFLKLWTDLIPSERLKCFIFEEDVVKWPHKTLKESYRMLGLDPEFQPKKMQAGKNPRWTWTHTLLNYHLGGWYRKSYRLVKKTPAAPLLDKIDFVKTPEIAEADIEFLRAQYLPEKNDLEILLGRKLDCWNYSY
jgi:hypothetical protein